MRKPLLAGIEHLVSVPPLGRGLPRGDLQGRSPESRRLSGGETQSPPQTSSRVSFFETLLDVMGMEALMDIREMILKGWRPMTSRSVTGKRDADGRLIEIFYFMRTRK